MRGEVMIRFDNVTKVYGNDTIALEAGRVVRDKVKGAYADEV